MRPQESHLETMAVRLRPSVLNAAFTFLLAIIANLAWATAILTTGPWFGPTVSLTVYSVALILGSLLAVVVAHHAVGRLGQLEASLTRLERRIALLRASAAKPSPPVRGEEELDLTLSGLADGGTSTLVRIEREGHDTLVPSSQPRSGSSAAHIEVLRQLVAERTAIREARSRVTALAAGPVLASLVFLTVAGPMLPGSDGFAAAHYVLNTTAVLFLSYGTAPLVAWGLLAIALMGSPAPKGSS